MNKVILIGRLVRDPEVSYLQSGADNLAKARFTLAVDRRFAKRDSQENTADFISCVAWRRTAEFLEKYGKKGTKLVVEGSIQTGSYTNKEGQKVYTTDVVVDNCEFAESKNAQGGSAPAGFDRPEPSGADEGFMTIPGSIDEELPFK